MHLLYMELHPVLVVEQLLTHWAWNAFRPLRVDLRYVLAQAFVAYARHSTLLTLRLSNLGQGEEELYSSV
jgi:hypothetical protein